MLVRRLRDAAGDPVTSAMAVRKAKAAGPAKGDWVASTCQGCTQWCAIQIFVQDGRAVRVRGNPLSKTNHGYVCPRGHLIPQQVYDPDRIKVPMKRTNPAKGRGVDPKFVPITWDEALDTVADKMMELRRNNEAHKLVYIRGRYSPTSTELLYGTLPKIYGTTNYFSHSAICAEAEKMGPGLTQGFFGYRDYDLEKTNCLVVWGCDPLASNRMVPNTIHRFHEIVARGTVITVDPRLSNAAAKAQEWLPIKPGTDGALAGAMAHVLLTEGLWNREFVGDFKDGKNLFVAGQTVDEAAFAEKETFGLVKWWNLELKDRTPAWAEKETLIPAAQIVRVARAMGKAAPKTAVWMGPGVAMNPRGTYAAMAVHALNGLLGSIDVEGGVWQSSSVPDRRVPEVRRLPRRRRQGRRQVQEARRPRRQGHAGDDERAARQRRGHQQRRQRHAEGPGRGQGVHLLVGELQLLLHRRRALGQGDGQGAVLRAHGDQPVGDDAVRRHRAAVDVQLGRGLVDRHQHGQRRTATRRSSRAPSSGCGTSSRRRPRSSGCWPRSSRPRASRTSSTTTRRSSRTPRPARLPTNALEFSEIATKITSATLWMPKEPLKGDAPLEGWADFRKKGMFSGAKYTLKKGWGGKFATETKKFEFYSETLKKGLLEHAKKYETTVDDILTRQRLRRARRRSPSSRTTSRPSATAASRSIRSRSSTTSRG